MKTPELCTYCKNLDTQRILDPVDLAPYVEHYGGEDFKAFACYCCGAKFSFRTL